MALAKLIIGQGWVVGLLFFAIETEAHLLREVKEISRKRFGEVAIIKISKIVKEDESS